LRAAEDSHARLRWLGNDDVRKAFVTPTRRRGSDERRVREKPSCVNAMHERGDGEKNTGE
jgi:hypothetical protein